MIEPLWLVSGLLFPAIVSAVMLWTCSFQNVPGGVVRSGWGLSIAAGFWIGYGATFDSLWLPPVESHEMIVLVLLPAAVAVSILGSICAVPWWLLGLGRFLSSVAAPILLLQPYWYYEWSRWAAVGWLGGLGLVGFVTWSSLVHLEHRMVWDGGQANTRSSWWLPWAGAMVTGGSGVTIMFSNSQTLGQLGLSMAAVLVATGMIFAIQSRLRSTQGYIDGSYLGLMGLWVVGYFYADLVAWHVALLVVAYQMPWLGELSPIRRLPSWKNGVLRLAGVAAVTAMVVVAAGLKFSQDALGGY